MRKKVPPSYQDSITVITPARLSLHILQFASFSLSESFRIYRCFFSRHGLVQQQITPCRTIWDWKPWLSVYCERLSLTKNEYSVCAEVQSKLEIRYARMRNKFKNNIHIVVNRLMIGVLKYQVLDLDAKLVTIFTGALGNLIDLRKMETRCILSWLKYISISTK